MLRNVLQNASQSVKQLCTETNYLLFSQKNQNSSSGHAIAMTALRLVANIQRKIVSRLMVVKRSQENTEMHTTFWSMNAVRKQRADDEKNASNKQLKRWL